jgi:riboflavin synthase alpha subunit
VFTGLIREIGRIETIARRSSITRLEVSGARTARTLAVGDSLAVDGICLTVTRRAVATVEVEATEETRRVTTLGRWTAGDRVHLEPALRAGDPIGGHFVLGHVDGVGRVERFERRGPAGVLRVAVPPVLAAQLLPKGSIAVDGVSLTLDEGPFRGTFSITLVPHTLAATNLGRLGPGDEVNLELDVLAKTAGRSVTASTNRVQPGGPTTLASLLARGWQRGPR